MNKINVIGIGPGSPDYIFPHALDLIRGSDIIAGGRRNLESVETAGKETIEISGKLEYLVELIKKNRDKKTISVIVSGDPGFYSMLNFLKKHFQNEDLNIIPGISSIQYMFAKIGKTWEEAYLGSVHGRVADIIDIVSKNKTVALLTDNKNSYKKIAEKLTENGHGSRMMYAGSNLSYNDEIIIKGRAKKLAQSEHDLPLCVVVITDEK